MAGPNRLNWMRSSSSDYEIALPLHEMESFMRGEGYYRGLPDDIRQEQIANMRQLSEQLYPRLRLYLFDARQLYSAPVTVFGPLLAVLYLGRNYLAFRDTNRVQGFTEHFDALVREATVTARGLPDFLDGLA